MPLTPDNHLTLIVGCYIFTAVYTTGVFLYLMRKFERMELNHLRHIERALNEVRVMSGLDPVDLDEDGFQDGQ